MQAVIFDLDDTLYAYEPLNEVAQSRVRDFACRTLGISEEQYGEAYRHGRSETKNMLGNVGASHNRLLYFQKTLEYLGVKPIPLSLEMYETYWGYFLENMKLYAGAREVLNSLHERGCKIAVCTDLTAHIQHRKIKALGIAEDVSYLITSEEAGQEKPAQEVFQLCLQKLKVPPNDIWYVGDSFERDIKGAVAAGMQAVWFRPADSAVPGKRAETVEDKEKGNGMAGKYEVVQDYGQLAELLSRAC